MVRIVKEVCANGIDLLGSNPFSIYHRWLCSLPRLMLLQKIRTLPWTRTASDNSWTLWSFDSFYRYVSNIFQVHWPSWARK
jgi:hypothetical protein